MKAVRFFLLICLAALVAFGLWRMKECRRVQRSTGEAVSLIPRPRTTAERIVNRAKLEAIRCVAYDASYAQIDYPGGDVASDTGACTDVLIRALRSAGVDLQKLLHEDMSRNFGLYPRKWGLSKPDPNIDHRRVPNHIVFMRRFALELPRSTRGNAAKSWKPGDLVYWDLGWRGATHCGVVSNEPGESGLPMVIHNIGPVATHEDCLTNWKIIGHFRFPRQEPAEITGSRSTASRQALQRRPRF